MPSKCLSKCSLLVVLVVALFLILNISTAIASFSGGRSGGRMGGSSFGSSPSSWSHRQSSPSSSSYRGLHDFEESSFSTRKWDRDNYRHPPHTFSSSHFHCHHHYSPPVSAETTCRFDHPQSSTVSEDEDENQKSSGLGLGLLIFGGVLLAIVGFIFLTEPWYEASVLMVQVGLSGNAKLLQGDLNRIAKTADTSCVKGFHRVLQETVSALLPHHDSWISGFSYVDKKGSETGAEKRFKQLSIEERKKVDIESLVNFNGVEEERASTHKANKLEKNYIVVTILVASRGAQNLPAIKTTKNLKTALEYLTLISLNDTMAVEVLWTPQDEGDTLSEDDLLENYHLLRPI